MKKPNKRGPKPVTAKAKQRLTLMEARPVPATRKDMPQWQDVHGDMHLDGIDAFMVNVKFAVEQIVQRDFDLEAIGNNTYEEDFVDLIMRNRDLLRMALSYTMLSPDDAFEEYMATVFRGKDWKSSEKDEDRIVRAAMREAFLAGFTYEPKSQVVS